MHTLHKVSPQWIIAITFTLLSVFWVAMNWPGLELVLADTDHGHQVAGGMQILHGEHPFIDFEATYGPLTFYASALALAIFGQRIIGEILLTTLGYTISYVLLALLIYRITGKMKLVFLFGLLAFFAMPRLYKYYIMLGPLLTIWFTWRYIDRPKLINIFLLALAVVFAGLFRTDFGIYCTIAATVAVVLQPSYKADGLKRVVILWTTIFLIALPYLLFLAFNGGLTHYFSDALIGGTNIASGMSLPMQSFQSKRSLFSPDNLMFIAMVFFRYFPFVMTFFLALFWKHIEETQRKLLLPLSILALLSLSQTYRFDYAHLLQAIPLSFILIPWVVSTVWKKIVSPKLRLASIVYLLLLMLAFVGPLIPFFLLDRNSLVPVSVLPSLMGKYTFSKDQILDSLKDHRHRRIEIFAQTAQYIRRCTTASQRLMAVPNFPNFYYFTDRSFGGGQLIFLAGYFVTETDQQRIIAKMEKQDIPLIVFFRNMVFSGSGETKFEVVASTLTRYINANYHSIKKDRKVDLVLRNNLTIKNHTNVLADLECPVPVP